MMKRLLSLFVLSLLAWPVLGQFYSVSYLSNPGTNPGALNTESETSTTGWTTIISGSQTNNLWSPATTIPFAFNFNGVAVTQFLASGNGLVTFTTSAAGVPPNPGAGLPDAALPDNTIAGFWGAWNSPSGSNDVCHTKVFGTAPNRQFWIRWFSFTWAGTTTFNYSAIVLEESTNTIYAVDQYNGAALSAVKNGIQINSTTAWVPNPDQGLKGNSTPITDNDYFTYTFFPAGTCIPPMNVQATNLTSSSADIGWNELNTGATAKIQYGAPGFVLGSGTIVTATGNPHTLIGLSPATNYQAYVKDSCGASNVTGWQGPVSFQTACLAALSGTYTLNSALATSGTNFQSFTDLASALNICGISGPVTVNVVAASGPYTEQFLLGAVAGTSSTNTITINGNGETIQYTSSNTNQRATIKLDGTDYTTINNLVVLALGTDASTIPVQYGYGIQLMNSADNNTINGCTVTVDLLATTSTDFGGIIASNSTGVLTTVGLAASYTTISNNTVNGGYLGIALNGDADPATAVFNTVSNNTLNNQVVNGIYLQNNEDAIVSGNDCSRATRASLGTLAFYGVQITGRCSRTSILGNKIHDNATADITNTGVAYGIWLNAVSWDNTATDQIIIANNAI